MLEKTRHGDRDVEISIHELHDLGGRTPVLVDDIISSGRTMIEAARVLKTIGAAAPVCIAVHGLFADGSDALLIKAGARVVTANTVPHQTNAIDVVALLAAGISELTA